MKTLRKHPLSPLTTLIFAASLSASTLSFSDPNTPMSTSSVNPNQPYAVGTKYYDKQPYLNLQGWSGHLSWDYQKFSNNSTTFAENVPFEYGQAWHAKNFNANTSYHSGYDIGLGYNIPGRDTTVNFDYMYLHSSDSSNASGENLILFPTGVAGATSAHNSLTFNYDSVDLTAGHFINFTPLFKMNFYGGLNYSHLARNMTTHANNFDGDITIRGGFSYNGFGPTFGADGYCSPFSQYPNVSLFGGIKPSLLYGTRTNFVNSTIDNVYNNENLPDEKIVVPAIGAKLGLNYDIGYKDMKYNIQLGYSLTNYFGVGKDVSYSNDVNTSFQGFFLNLGAKL